MDRESRSPGPSGLRLAKTGDPTPRALFLTWFASSPALARIITLTRTEKEKMTRVDLIRELYQTALSRHGENAGSTRMLKAQLDRMEGMLQRGPLDSPLENHFLIGSWARDEEAKLPPEEEEDSQANCGSLLPSRPRRWRSKPENLSALSPQGKSKHAFDLG
jgi:hypothetical protein